ncbi:MAG: ATP synthase F0 subunit C [Candidatus Omnitrophica bacterium]|nr:ATP synthase F0 subunit C [Candidatus Omnitrophota bacterium]
MSNLILILIMFLATLGPAAVIGVVGFAAVRAVGRNPSASPRILLAMITAFIFAEAIAIMAILIVFGLFK